MSVSHKQSLPIPVEHGVPHTKAFDSTLKLLSEGYPFFQRRCNELGSDVFTTRLMGRRAICVSGPEAARMFWQPGRFTRRGAIPPTTLMLLQDFGSAQTLDGEDHRHRKAMMMSLQTPADRARMVTIATEEWRARFARWPGQKRVVLFDEAESVLCAAAWRWAGIPAADIDHPRLTREFSAMIDGAGNAIRRTLQGLVLRSRTEHWAKNLIQAVRGGRTAPPPESPLAVIARHRDRDEQPLPVDIAANELINVLRPVVAVARFIIFGAQAMHEFPEWRPRIATGDDATLTMFAQEVRRYYPFFPAVGGRVLNAFDWRGLHFDEGTWVLFDMYGTNHDPAIWPEPQRFKPERFARWQSDAFDLVPQGAGDYLTGHRCPGEAMTVDLVKSALHLLASEVVYQVPRQDLTISLSRMPTMPASRFLIDVAAPVR
ncbi:cytochrome P450 [Massilia consociata]|uniref:Cytochrome P450 n=1 Tax=Massilia consociata TaxID=760117 RepID=A0ABV6FIS7_9BURK